MNGERRRVLAGLGTAGLVSLVGCAGGPLGGGSGDEVSPVERWSPAREATGIDGRLLIIYEALADLLEHEDALASGAVERFESTRSEVGRLFGVDPATVGVNLAVAPGQEVVLGSFEATTVADTLDERARVTADGEYRGYDIYRDGRNVVGVTDGVVVNGRGRDRDPRAAVETAIDASAGESRLVDVDSDAAAVVPDGESDVVVASLFSDPVGESASGLVPGSLGSSLDVVVEGATATETYRYVFPSADSVDIDAVVAAVESSSREYDAGEPTVDGRVVTVTGTVPTDQLSGF